MKKGTGFTYRDPSGKTLRDRAVLQRIRKLVIPPAWTDVWICPDPDGHLQATGRDAAGRKQHRYHPDYRRIRQQTKYHRMLHFARILPRVRQTTARHLRQPGLPRQKVLAAVVRLLEDTLIRIGNEQYARQNGHFGLTTLQDRHVTIRGQTARFSFRGKSGVRRIIQLHDRRLAKIIKACRELPGQDLFQYIDDDDQQRDVTSTDVNAYLREITGEDFTAKDFRTWAGTVLAASALRDLGAADTQAQAKKNIVTAVDRVARQLGNTRAVCRKCYIHPQVINAYLRGITIAHATRNQPAIKGLEPDEVAVLALLQ